MVLDSHFVWDWKRRYVRVSVFRVGERFEVARVPDDEVYAAAAAFLFVSLLSLSEVKAMA